ncbi:hypothetical protein [Pelotomaculum sp. PtaB.Bin117]|uniref:hypothetical protein n=1 Tax=Pelotomaculum sp. PtaB.Bin117 TaxID=1811694 RepID=UPI0009C514B5|nr:hypothetical protein [Pelotomaculum sp. PtaB.Bin117]OPX85067.1 MAG: hypothetical protein A4E54_02617 [Pelotomaculum sp. PtaB.Bin117]
MRETVQVYCPHTKQEVIGLLKFNPSIHSDNITPEYDFIYCTGEIDNCTKAAINCPFAKICVCKLH